MESWFTTPVIETNRRSTSTKKFKQNYYSCFYYQQESKVLHK